MTPRHNRADWFSAWCRANRLPAPEREYRFHHARRWRFDYAFVEDGIAVEQEGGLFIRGRHARGSGIVKDMEKYNAATVAGWRVLRYTPQQLQRGEALLDLLALGMKRITATDTPKGRTR